MNLLSQLLHRNHEVADGVVLLSLQPRGSGSQQQPSRGRSSGGRSSSAAAVASSASACQASPLASALGALLSPFAASRPRSCNDGGTAVHQAHRAGADLSSLPLSAACLIWGLLSSADRRHLRLVSSVPASIFSHAVSSLQVDGRGSLQPGDISKLSSTFPSLSRLELSLGGADASSSNSSVDEQQILHELRGLRLPHVHSFACDAKLRGDALLAVARFLVHTPTLTSLSLPNQRGSAPADQRVLCAVIEALPGLVQLDLGGAGAGSAPVSPSLLRRITRLLPGLQCLACNAAGVPDEQLLALGRLHSLRELSIGASGPSARGLAAALQSLLKLTSLELQHPGLSHELVGVVGGLCQLRVLALALCPQVSPDIVPEVSELLGLQKLALPFALGPTQLRFLCRLPDLSELLCWSGLELDALGLAHDPLRAVTRLVAGSINGHGQPLCACFPSVAEVVLRSCGDMEALSLRPCAGLSVLIARECSGLSDHGLAALRGLRSLQRLQVDGAAQLSDASFAVVFSSTMPALQHISVSGAPHVTDAALQHLTAACRRLASISISDCPQLTDKTLKRLAHCEHLASITLRCMGRALTSAGVAALAAAPHVKAVSISGCPGVRRSAANAFRPGVRVRLESSSRSSHSGAVAAA